jgi:hypothetical protein
VTGTSDPPRPGGGGLQPNRRRAAQHERPALTAELAAERAERRRADLATVERLELLGFQAPNTRSSPTTWPDMDAGS